MLLEKIDTERALALGAFEGKLKSISVQALRQSLLNAKENLVLGIYEGDPDAQKAYFALAAENVLDGIKFAIWQSSHKGTTCQEGVEERLMQLAGELRFYYQLV